MTLRSLALKYLDTWLGRPYIWGGDDPSGIDCSGLIVEVLTGVGLMQHNEDATAQMLFDKFKHNQTTDLKPGAIVCYFNKAGLCTHVAMLIDQTGITIQAAGAGSATTSPDAAWQQNAFVKMRPLDYRSDKRLIVDPFAGTD